MENTNEFFEDEDFTYEIKIDRDAEDYVINLPYKERYPFWHKKYKGITAEQLRQLSKEEILDFIRYRLTVDGEKLRFNMSGYDCYDEKDFQAKRGSCTVHNQSILNRFADLGIYDHTHFLFVDFYKGTPYIFLKYWDSDLDDDGWFTGTYNDDLSGSSTSEIIYEVFKITILTGERRRRRY